MPVSGVLGRLLEYWQTLPRVNGADIPSKHVLHPTDLHELLPRISLMKRIDRYDVQVSMIGTSENNLWQTPIAGMNAFDLTTPAMRENTARLYEAILDQPSGANMLETIKRRNGSKADVESLYLPLANDDGKATYIIGCSVYLKQPSLGRINDRLVLDHQRISNIQFIDLGRGLPHVIFEKPQPRPQPQPEHRWWERFMPTRPRPAPDTMLDA
ncbi:MAG: PAS domain-containing protein [Alphaproteobacteria bacterium]|nr:PAS domain-containing protein [Alphaproteobacteria bacterium]